MFIASPPEDPSFSLDNRWEIKKVIEYLEQRSGCQASFVRRDDLRVSPFLAFAVVGPLNRMCIHATSIFQGIAHAAAIDAFST